MHHGSKNMHLIWSPDFYRMLMGVSNLYLLEYNGRYYSPRHGLCVPHLTGEVLQEFLADFTRYGSYLQILHVGQ